MLKIKILNVTKKELLRDLQRASEFDQSALFKKVYEEEFGVFGGAPFRRSDRRLRIRQAARKTWNCWRRSPTSRFCACAVPDGGFLDLMNLGEFYRSSAPRAISPKYSTPRNMRSGSLSAASEDSRYVALALPHVLMRLPYGKDTKPVDGFNYEEGVDGTDHTKYLWGNAAYALGARLTDAFAKYGWCAAIRGVEGGGMVEGLPVHTFRTDEGDMALKCPTEVAITDRREKELADLGSCRWCTARTPTTPPSSACRLPKSRRSTTRKPPTPMPVFPPNCHTFWPSRVSRTISRR